MKQKIHINDQGELLLIDSPEMPERVILHDHHFEFTTSYRKKWIAYDQALTVAIEKGIKFRDQEAVTKILIDLANEDRNLYTQGSFYIKDHLGQSFDVPNSYTAEVVEEIDPYVDPYGSWTRKVAVLTPLKQSGEPGNEAKKDEVSLYDQLKTWLSEVMLNPKWTWQQITKDDGQYFAINDGKRFVAYNHDVKFGKTWFGIREDGDTRTVFNGTVETLDDVKRIWQLTTH